MPILYDSRDSCLWLCAVARIAPATTATTATVATCLRVPEKHELLSFSLYNK